MNIILLIILLVISPSIYAKDSSQIIDVPSFETGIGTGFPYLVHLNSSISPTDFLFIEGDVGTSLFLLEAQLVVGYQRKIHPRGTIRYGLGYGSAIAGTPNGATSDWNGVVGSIAYIKSYSTTSKRFGWKFSGNLGYGYDDIMNSDFIFFNFVLGFFVRIL